MAITQLDVACKAKVSRATVSNTFYQPHKVKEDVRNKIIKVANSLGYRPNVAARTIRGGKFDCITLLHDSVDERSHLPKQLMCGISDALERNNMYLNFVHIADKSFSVDIEHGPKILRQMAADGFLLNYHSGAPTALEKMLSKINLPYVWINSRREFDSVSPDDFGSTKLLTEQLIQKGHKNICFLDILGKKRNKLTDFHFSRVLRPNGYKEAMLQNNLEPDIKILEEKMPNIDYFRFLLRSPDRPTAIICYSDLTYKLLFVSALANGMKIPEELELISFADSFLSDGIANCGMVIPWYQMGEQAVNMLLKKLEHPAEPIASELVPHSYVNF